MVAVAVTAIVAAIVSRYDYLLFHSLIELFTAVVMFSIFMMAWNTRDLSESRYTSVLGTGILFVGVVSLLHALAYKGMGVFPAPTSNLATQLWIFSRGLEAAAFLLAGIALLRPVSLRATWIGFTAATALGLAAMFWWRVFPAMYVEGAGLTPLKIALEWVVMGVLAAAGVLLWMGRERLAPYVTRILLAAVGLTIAAELAFTLYVDVYGFFNMLGHVLTLAAFCLVYLAILDTGLRRPSELMFRELAERERAEHATSQALETTNVRLQGLIEQLAEANQRLDEATKAKSDFLRNMSHELRTPLNSIIGFSTVLAGQMPGPLNEEQLTQLRMIEEAGESLLALVNDLLDLSRIEAGVVRLDVHEFDARSAAESGLALVRPLADEKHLSLVADLPEQPTTIVSDPARIEQILVNLLGNAVKFTDQGSVKLEVTASPEWVEFAVEDTGRGIPASEIDAVFDEFHQVEPSARKSRTGAGLGLPLAKRLADLLGGEISARSSLGHGSVFTLRLPAQPTA